MRPATFVGAAGLFVAFEVFSPHMARTGAVSLRVLPPENGHVAAIGRREFCLAPCDPSGVKRVGEADRWESGAGCFPEHMLLVAGS